MPQERDLPTGTAEVTDSGDFTSSVEDISNLLGDPETDLETEDQDQATAEPDPDEEEGAEDVETVDDEDPDGSEPELKGGRFAPDTAKVTLDDGTVTTVAELKRNNLFQRDYTKKTTELSTEKETVKAKAAEVDQYAQSLNQHREYLAWFAEQNMPKRPAPFTGSPLANAAEYLQWQHAENQWRSMQEAYQTFQQQKQADEQRAAQERQAEGQGRLKSEAAKLAEAFPILNNPEKRQGFWSRLETGAQKYFGITADEVRTVGDHRILKALHAAVKQKQIEEKAPQVREEVLKRPQPGGKRQQVKPQGTREKQARSERLRSSGDFQSAVASLMDLDL